MSHRDTSNPILELEQRAQLKPGKGGRMALEDQAIQAYQDAIDDGLAKDEAAKQYFLVFSNSAK